MGRGARMRWAIAASAAIHLGLVLLLLRQAHEAPPPLPPPPKQVPIQVFEVPPPPERGAADPNASHAPAGEDSTAGAGPALPGTQVATAGNTPPNQDAAGLAGSAPADLEDGRPPAVVHSPDATETPPPIVRRPPPLDLYPGFKPPPPSAEEPRHQEKKEAPERPIERRLDAFFAENRAVYKAEHRADPYWADLGRRMERGFKAPMEMVEEGAADGSLGIRGVWRAYTERASAYGSTGNPYGDGPGVPGAPASIAEDMTGVAARRIGADPSQEPIGEQSLFLRRLVAQVEIDQAPDGRVLGVRLVASSGVPGFDRLALGHARSSAADAVEHLGAPPAQGRRTRWAFASTLTIIPPLPMAGCSFDAYFVPQDCFYPLKKILRSRVYLLAIYDDVDVRANRAPAGQR